MVIKTIIIPTIIIIIKTRVLDNRGKSRLDTNVGAIFPEKY